MFLKLIVSAALSLLSISFVFIVAIFAVLRRLQELGLGSLFLVCVLRHQVMRSDVSVILPQEHELALGLLDLEVPRFVLDHLALNFLARLGL